MFALMGSVGGPAQVGSRALPVRPREQRAAESDRPSPVEAVRGWTRELLDAPASLTDDAQRIDMLRALQELACAVAGAQAVVTVDFDTSQCAEQAAAGVPTARQGRGVAAQVALARRESPHWGQRHLGLAKILVAEMPHTLHALTHGHITEYRAIVLAQETACLSREDRGAIDRAIAGDAEALAAIADRELVGDIRKLAYQLDPASVVARRAQAEADRRVTLRPAPDTMSRLNALLPVAQGVAVFAALSKEADRLRAEGDPRSRGQLMADLLVQRATLAAPATPGGPPIVPTTLDLVVSDKTLLGGGDEPAQLVGFGQVPADLARSLVHDTLDAGLEVWLRRLYADPDGKLVVMDSRARLFPKLIAKMLVIRDRVCRTPWCGAPVRHLDHVVDHRSGGETSLANGQGLCEACNHAKQAPGWRAGPAPGGPVVTRTPTGHTYASPEPKLPKPYDGA